MAQDNFNPPLTTEQLHDIGVRRDPGDIIPLLWEIKRLRALVLRADQVVKGIRHGDYIVEVFRKELEGEPVLEERARLSASVDLNARPPAEGRRRRDE
jgi:hypothetical protein